MRGMRQMLEWIPDHGVASFTRIYDDDIIYGNPTTNSPVQVRLDWEVRLCSLSFLPCSLNFAGTIHRQHEKILCLAQDGCLSVNLRNTTFQCKRGARALSGPLQVGGLGATLNIVDSTISDCASIEDGGSARAYTGARVAITRSVIQRSSSQVLMHPYQNGVAICQNLCCCIPYTCRAVNLVTEQLL